MAKAQFTLLMNEQEKAEIEAKRAKNREYQRKYREKAKDRIVVDKNGKKRAKRADLKRLDLYLPVEVKQTLEQLAYSTEKSQTEIIEELILKAHKELYLTV